MTEENNKQEAESKEANKNSEKAAEVKVEEKKPVETKKVEETKKEEKKVEKKKEKKTEAIVRGLDIGASTKKSAAICKFIKGKRIDYAVEKLIAVEKKKFAIPINREYPHKKRIMSGIYPVKTAGIFIKLLRSLQANASVNGLELEKTRIAIAKADIASRPARTDNRKFKRSHVLLIAREMENKKQEKKEKK